MPLDPVSALAVASNVIQFVDFTAKLISTGTEIYRNNSSVEHAELKAAAEQLRDLQLSMKHSSDDIDKIKEDGDMQNGAIPLFNLREAHASCVECANNIIAAVEKLTVSGGHRKWKSFRHALTSVLKEDKLDATSQRLSNARQQLILFLLLYAQ